MSATYTPALLEQLEALMTQPQRVLLSPDTTSLLGVRQFYSLVPGTSSSACCILVVGFLCHCFPLTWLPQVSHRSYDGIKLSSGECQGVVATSLARL